MCLELALRLLGERDASQQTAQQACIAPVWLVPLVGAAHHHPRAVEGRRAVVGPLHTFPVCAIDVRVFAQYFERACADSP